MRLNAALASLAMCALALAGRAHAAAPQQTPPAVSLFDAPYAAPYRIGAGSDVGLQYVPGQGLVRWRWSEAVSPGRPDDRFVDSVRLSTAAYAVNPGMSLMRPWAGENVGRQAFEVTYIRNWPAVVSVQKGRLSLDITPHAGFGLSSAGAQLAEVGAILRLGAQAMQAVGARNAFEGGRLYLFAGANGRAVGLNLLRSETLARDLQSDGRVREAQAGLGFQRGAFTASVGYTYERIRLRGLGENSREDSRVGLTLAVHPFR